MTDKIDKGRSQCEIYPLETYLPVKNAESAKGSISVRQSHLVLLRHRDGFKSFR